MSEQPIIEPKKDLGFIIDFNRVFQDETTHEIYFNKVEPLTYRVLGRITPDQLGFKKRATQKIYVFKQVNNIEELEAEQIVYFEMTLTFSFDKIDSKNTSTQFFYTVKSGRVFLRDFASSVCSECSINSEYVTRSKAVKLKENTLIARNAPVFRLNSNNELERYISEDSIW